MSYQVLARKWRPQRLEEVIGQEHVSTILRHGLKTQKLHHAYLFCGTRGVGKTSLARLLAKCLNCMTGITDSPCGQCESCQQIARGDAIDVLEVDAASRTKVENTRELLDNVPYAPAHSRFKVYLIDEVHMLSNHSFNALLKTLEEPPQHVKFIMATTEPEKIPVTVLSRCMQFHLKTLSLTHLNQLLSHVLAQESIDYEPEAVDLLAEAAQGSARDALSLLEQTVAFGAGRLQRDRVCQLLGTIDRQHIYQLLHDIIQKKAHQAVDRIAHLIELGTHLNDVLAKLLQVLHEVARAQMIKEIQAAPEIQTLSDALTPEDTQLLYQIGLIGQRDFRSAPNPQIGLEMTVLRMMAFQPKERTATQPTTHQPPPSAPAKQDRTQQPPISPTTEASSNPPWVHDHRQWAELVQSLSLTGISLMAVNHCIVKQLHNQQLHLLLDPSKGNILTSGIAKRIEDALKNHIPSLKLHIDLNTEDAPTTPQAQRERDDEAQKKVALDKAHHDPAVQSIMGALDAQIISAT